MESSIVSICRYPVKSMMGEELNACFVTEKGLLGDREYALIDQSTGKLANAKNPLKWPDMFSYRAAFIDPPLSREAVSPVRITLPDGSYVSSDRPEINDTLSGSLGRTVKLEKRSSEHVQFEGYIPDIEELANRKGIFTVTSPEGTFFDIAMVHLLTTSTINQLRGLAPDSRFEVRRFRPNLVIDVPGAEGFIENTWVGKTLSIGNEVILNIIQPTKRCVMTTLAQGDLPQDLSILKTAVKQNDGTVGVYASVVRGGTIRRGDRVAIVDSSL